MTTKDKILIVTASSLLFGYVGLALSTAHPDAGSVWRLDAANVVGAMLVLVVVIAGVIYAPGYLAQQAQRAAREVLKETPEQRARQIEREARSRSVKAIAVGMFVAAAAIYECFFTPDAQYSRVRSDLDRLEGHQEEAIASLVEHGRDPESARFVVATRIRRLHVEADRLWPDTKAAKKVAPQLPPGVLRP